MLRKRSTITALSQTELDNKYKVNASLTSSMLEKSKYVVNSSTKEIISQCVVEFLEDKVPPIHPSRILPWQAFTRNFEGTDLKLNPYIENIIKKSMDMQLDFRPYCNDNPMTVNTFDSLSKICELFRKMHLRCLPVLNNVHG